MKKLQDFLERDNFYQKDDYDERIYLCFDYDYKLSSTRESFLALRN